MTTCFKLARFLPEHVCKQLGVSCWKNAVDGVSEANAWDSTYTRIAMQIINVEIGYNVWDVTEGIPTAINLTNPKRRGMIDYSINSHVSGVIVVRGNNFGNIYVPYGWDKTAVSAFIDRITRTINGILDAAGTEYGLEDTRTLRNILYEEPNKFYPQGYRRINRVCSSSTQCQIIVKMPGLALREFVYDAKDDSSPSTKSYMTWSIVEQSREPPIPHMGRLAQNTQSYLNSIVIDQYGVFNVADADTIFVCLSKKHTNIITETGVMDRPVISPIGKASELVPSGDKFRDSVTKFSQHDKLKIVRGTATVAEITPKLISQSWSVEQQDRTKLEFQSPYVCINCQGLIAGKCYALKISNAKSEQWRLMHITCAHLAGMSTILDTCYSEVAEFETPLRSVDIISEFAKIDNAALLMVSESHFTSQIEHSKKALLELDQIEQINLDWAKRGIVVTPNYIFADSSIITELAFRDDLVDEINTYYGTPGKNRIIIQCFILGISPPDPENN